MFFKLVKVTELYIENKGIGYSHEYVSQNENNSSIIVGSIVLVHPTRNQHIVGGLYTLELLPVTGVEKS